MHDCMHVVLSTGPKPSTSTSPLKKIFSVKLSPVACILERNITQNIIWKLLNNLTKYGGWHIFLSIYSGLKYRFSESFITLVSCVGRSIGSRREVVWKIIEFFLCLLEFLYFWYFLNVLVQVLLNSIHPKYQEITNGNSTFFSLHSN